MWWKYFSNSESSELKSNDKSTELLCNFYHSTEMTTYLLPYVSASE